MGSAIEPVYVLRFFLAHVAVTKLSKCAPFSSGFAPYFRGIWPQRCPVGPPEAPTRHSAW
jgi:hypothetical protein